MRRLTPLTLTLCGLCLTAAMPALAARKTAGSAATKKKGASRGGSSKSSKTVDAPTPKNFDPISEPNPGNAPVAGATPTPSGAPPPTRGPTRLDFDDRLIQGQSNKSGSVYLYDRKELKNRSMVKKRESFRSEIIGTVYDTE